MTPNFNILANCALYYYRDLAQATRFYGETLGFDLAEDYGFGKLFQVASTSYLMLIDASIGRHSADEPKTVTTAFLTDELEGWWDYLTGLNLPIRAPFNYQPGKAHDGFVVVDPEGYYLEFERFNAHPENALMMPLLAGLPSHYPPAGQTTTCPANLGVKATVTWLYYQDLERAGRFWRDTFGLTEVIDQGFAKVFPTSPSGFIGPVRAGDGLHPYTAEKGVTVSLFTNAVDKWFNHLQTQPDFALQTDEVLLEMESVRDFLGLDPEGYFIEFDEFIEHPKNAALRARLFGSS
jgi:catechol 2,3-dioxygenase-like lactoylglutathione lyase family enzyme